MNILFDYSIFFHQKLGGISRYFLNLQKQFEKKKHIKTKIFAPIHSNKFLKKENENKFINFYIKDYPKYSRKIIKSINYSLSKLYCNYYKPHIIHKTFYSKNFNHDSKTKKIITVYDLIHEIYYKDFGKSENYLPKYNILKSIDFIICPSYKTKSDLINFYKIPEEKIRVIYMGIHQFDKIITSNIKKIDKPFILYVGDRKRYKNFKNFIKAFSISKKIQNDFKLVCFGGGSFSNEEKLFLTELGININEIMQIEGDDSQLCYLYKNAKAFIFPSLYEGFGLPQLEAMSLGCPVISSNHEAIVEAVGDSAILFDPNEPDDIAEKISHVLYSNELLGKLKFKGFERSKIFTWEKCASETLDVYKKITN